MRALSWGRDFLELLAEEQKLDPAIREQARSLLPTYPRLDQLARLVADDALCLSADAAVAIRRAYMHFMRLNRDDGCSDVVLCTRLLTMRHFPGTEDIDRWSRPVPGFRLSDWLWLEGRYK